MGFENGSVLRVTLGARSPSGDTVVNTLHYDVEDATWPSNDVDPQSLADKIRDDVRPSWATLFVPSYAILPVAVIEEKDPQNPTAARRSWESGSEIAGTSTSVTEKLPTFITAVVKLKTDLVGRRHTGRLFIPGSFTESMQADGLWTSSMMTAFASIVDTIPQAPDLVTGFSFASCKWSVYSRTARAADQDPYLAEITSYQVRAQLHSLRSRAPY